MKTVKIGVLLSLISSVAIAVPNKLTYQGRLLQPDGNPASGVVAVVFGIYDASTGGAPLWSETENVAPTDGYYSVELGSVTSIPDSVFDGSIRYLDVSVGGTSLTPRQPINSVAYAVRAGVAERVANAGDFGVYRATYDFEEGSGTTSADGTGSARTLTLSSSGTAWTTAGHTGKALSFDGASGSATAPPSPAFDLGPTASLEAWVFVPAAVTGTMTVLSRGTAYRLAITNMSLQASFETQGGPAVALMGSGPVNANTWVHVAAVYDGLTVRTFVDGLQTSETRYPYGLIKPSVQPFVVGAAPGGTDNFNGKIDEVRIATVPLRFPGHRGNVVCGLTAPASGSFGGWSGVRTACQAACGSATAHLCDVGEIARSWQYGAALPASGAWVASTTAVGAVSGCTGGSVTGRSDLFSGYAGCCAWNTATYAITGVTFPTAMSSTILTNCTGWTGVGSAQIAKDTDFGTATCGTSLPAACCD